MIDARELEQKLWTALHTKSAEAYVPFVPKNHRGHSCSVAGCPNVAFAKGMCNAHYIRARKGMRLDRPLQQRGRKAVCAVCGDAVDGKGGWSLCKHHYRLQRRQMIRQVCVEALGGKCQRCGGVFPHVAYDFHHRNPQEKTGAPSNMTGNASLAAISREVAMCELLCANCHRIEHNAPELPGGPI